MCVDEWFIFDCLCACGHVISFILRRNWAYVLSPKYDMTPSCVRVGMWFNSFQGVTEPTYDRQSMIWRHLAPTVEMAPDQVCSGSTFIVPDSRSGYLSSLIALDTGRGSPECPWLIRTEPGRRVVIDLIDFGHGQSERTDFLSNGYDLCSVYAIVREPNTPNELTVCAGIERNKTVYTSVSHTIEVSILGERGSFSEIGYFILKYEGTMPYIFLNLEYYRISLLIDRIFYPEIRRCNFIYLLESWIL